MFKRKTNTQPNQSLVNQNKNLDALIRAKHRTLLELDHEIESKTIIRNTGFSKTINSVLDIYDQSHIRLPLDIIEDLQSESFTTEKEVFDYIENQRLFWKLENTKKPFRKVK